jgi:hypothetical protein
MVSKNEMQSVPWTWQPVSRFPIVLGTPDAVVPRVGSIAAADSSASGASAGERRRAVTGLEETPLRTGGAGISGSAAIDPRFSVAKTNSSATAVAKSIISDDNRSCEWPRIAGARPRGTIEAFYSHGVLECLHWALLAQLDLVVRAGLSGSLVSNTTASQVFSARDTTNHKALSADPHLL